MEQQQRYRAGLGSSNSVTVASLPKLPSRLAAFAEPGWKSLCRIVGTAGLIICALVITLAAAIILGAYFTGLPYAGVRGPFALGSFTPHFVIGPLLATIWIAMSDLRSKATGKLLIAIGALATLLAGNVLWRVAEVARANEVELSLADALDPHMTMHSPTSSHQLAVPDGSGGDIPLAIYAPDNATEAPVVVYIHGGGFVGGSHQLRGDDWRWFAEQGFLVIGVGYPLSSSNEHHWDRAIGEIGCALAWIRGHAEELGGDGKRVALIGDSAGGNLVLNAGYRAGAGTLPQSCVGELPRISAIGALYPVVSVARFHDNPDPRTAASTRPKAIAFTGGSPEELPDRYAAVDPVQHMTAAAPPTLLIHGTHDTTVQIDASQDLLDEARESGAPVRLIEIPFAEHAFDMRATLGNQIMRQAMRDHFRDALAR